MWKVNLMEENEGDVVMEENEGEEFDMEENEGEEDNENFYTSFLVEYVRKSKNNRNKKGILLAIREGNRVIIGWSLCKPVDVFDVDFGWNLAYERGLKKFDESYYFDFIPASMVDQMERFLLRCEKYFKDCDLPLWV